MLNQNNLLLINAYNAVQKLIQSSAHALVVHLIIIQLLLNVKRHLKTFAKLAVHLLIIKDGVNARVALKKLTNNTEHV